MGHVFSPNRMGSLISERRHQAVQRREPLQRAGIEVGQRILDLGCGAGQHLPVYLSPDMGIKFTCNRF